MTEEMLGWIRRLWHAKQMLEKLKDAQEVICSEFCSGDYHVSHCRNLQDIINSVKG